MRILVPPVLANTCYFLVFGDSHPSGCEVMSHWGFGLYFSGG